MNRHILLGIDPAISPATRYAITKVSELVEQAPAFHVILLTVIPIPYTASPSLGMYVGQIQPLPITSEQRSEAEEVLKRARLELQKYAISSERIEMMIRVGEPAGEIVRAARELGVDLIVVGSRGESLRHKLRRLLVGSISRRVLALAPCPVMIVMAPPIAHPSDLVAWYRKALTAYLEEHTGALAVFTPQEVATMFLPASKKKAGRKEIAAATLALEHLVNSGRLCRHEVQGQLRYVND
ncbi:universal stress protein [Thermogemmatispora sp.]|uniref:universal stress protein n=1 Tax=Thermogemmatispora sp. TaxID=1968838 RepID=UPI0035E41712